MKKWLPFVFLLGILALPVFANSPSPEERKSEYRTLFLNFSRHLENYRHLQAQQCAQASFEKSCQTYLAQAPFLVNEAEFLKLVNLISDPFLEDAKTYKPHFIPNIRAINNLLRQISGSLFTLVNFLTLIETPPSSPKQESLSRILITLISFHGTLYDILKAQQRIRW